MRPGKEPHGALQNVHVDQAARKAIIKEKAGAMPDEAVIVEESCRPDKKLAAVTVRDEKKLHSRVQVNRWLKNSPDAKPTVTGKAAPLQTTPPPGREEQKRRAGSAQPTGHKTPNNRPPRTTRAAFFMVLKRDTPGLKPPAWASPPAQVRTTRPG
jgi:hypothetical protein